MMVDRLITDGKMPLRSRFGFNQQNQQSTSLSVILRPGSIRLKYRCHLRRTTSGRTA
jgi:hypothetical protein